MLDVAEPVFGVKLKKTGTRVPVVLSQGETQRVFGELGGEVKAGRETGGRYCLAARLQYGAGLRVSELVRLRIKDVDLERGRVKGFASRDPERIGRRRHHLHGKVYNEAIKRGAERAGIEKRVA